MCWKGFEAREMNLGLFRTKRCERVTLLRTVGRDWRSDRCVSCCCVQAIEKLKLDNESPPPGVRPIAQGIQSCVGTEYVAFAKPLPLNGKVRTPCQPDSLHTSVLEVELY